jgi:integrase
MAALLDTSVPATTCAALWIGYEAHVLVTKAEATQRSRRKEWAALLPVFGKVTPRDIESGDVYRYWLDRGRTPQAKHEIRCLSALLTYARQIGAVKHPNPCFGLRLPDAPARSRYVTDAEFLAVREHAPAMVGYAMDLALLTGLRQRDILRLERRHITDDGIEVTTSKTGAGLVILWNDELRATVAACLKETPQVRRCLVCRRDGRAYTSDGFRALWQRLMAKAGPVDRWTFHDLRAKSASDAQSDQEAADRLGHRDPALTRRIYRRLPRRALALRVLDKPGSFGQPV